MSLTPHITVCICTYKRVQLLENLLFALEVQRTDGLFSFSAVVVDNDGTESAGNMVGRAGKEVKYRIEYYVEPRQNIALARNRAVLNAEGDFIAMIDDDEVPIKDWLYLLLVTLRSSDADGVLGPVKPHFEGQPPTWLVRGKFCERESHKTGTILQWEQTRTGNTLLRRSLFARDCASFDPERGRTGGEDIEFFKKLMNRGRKFIWCNEAVVFEIVSRERWRRIFYVKKYLQMGGVTGEMVKKWSFPLKCKWFGKAILSMSFHSLALPFSNLIGHHVFMKCFLKDVYYLGWFVGFLWRPIIRFRYK